MVGFVRIADGVKRRLPIIRRPMIITVRVVEPSHDTGRLIYNFLSCNSARRWRDDLVATDSGDLPAPDRSAGDMGEVATGAGAVKRLEDMTQEEKQ